MKTRHQNIGQWRATRLTQERGYTIKISAVIPTTDPASPCNLIAMEEFSNAESGLVLRLENTKYLNVESESQTYLVHRTQGEAECPYKNVIIIGFRANETKSFLIAIIDIDTDLAEF
ncbi:hypothetical protein OQZ33_17155 [Pedobacter sp. MC2016-05]|uniref:hypothetical protein n=1 Tax=Pedobacter sp. MC2016-05 TaxID=2994474 RepID=UPI002246EF21|nr:hypothetical protein [Pedobacter sp. MC2016-05]MCX2476065.1 hypothetical protein [Pedobacter sp. MC2016-05]